MGVVPDAHPSPSMDGAVLPLRLHAKAYALSNGSTALLPVPQGPSFATGLVPLAQLLDCPADPPYEHVKFVIATLPSAQEIICLDSAKNEF